MTDAIVDTQVSWADGLCLMSLTSMFCVQTASNGFRIDARSINDHGNFGRGRHEEWCARDWQPFNSTGRGMSVKHISATDRHTPV